MKYLLPARLLPARTLPPRPNPSHQCIPSLNDPAHPPPLPPFCPAPLPLGAPSLSLLTLTSHPNTFVAHLPQPAVRLKELEKPPPPPPPLASLPSLVVLLWDWGWGGDGGEFVV